MKIKILIYFSLGLLLTACTSTGNGGAEPTININEMPTAIPTSVYSEPTSATMQTYQNDRFSLQYPGDLILYENERPSADGVTASIPDSIALKGDNYLLTLTTFAIGDGGKLADFIAGHQECMSMMPGEPTAVGDLAAMIFPDTPCGLSGTTYLFTVAGDTGYRFAIETTESFATVKTEVQPILTSFRSKIEPATPIQVNHEGIIFSYDPTLLGEAQIQDIPASADQGMFEQPSPAHTWIGFVPASIQRDVSNHWALAWEPYLIVYHLNDFGSFGLGDLYARERVNQFQHFLAERPSAVTDPIPVIPPINAGQIIRAQVKWLDFGNGAGVRFVTQYDQAADPINNEGLVYIFQGITADGLHGVTAVFPLDAAGLPDGPAMSEPEYTAFIENFDQEMAAVTEALNAAPDSDFSPPLSLLDALVQSITITPTDTDFAMTVLEPEHGHVRADTDIFTSPAGQETRGSLEAGAAVVINAISEDGRRYRLLCPDGATGNCWVEVDALQTGTKEVDPVPYTGEMARVGDVVQVTAVTDNTIFEGPGETYQPIGELLAGEIVEVFGLDGTDQWLAVVCPRNIGENCWVISDPVVNEPTGFFAGDGWQDVTSEYVSFRVPGTWQPTAVTPGMGSVLAEWHLGIPDVENDQVMAFSSVPYDQLRPNEILGEYDLPIGEQPGVKWVRQSPGYISYDYYAPGTASTQRVGAGSFGLHVTVPEADPELEAILDMVAASIIFNK